MSGRGALFPLLLLVVTQRREHVRPGFHAQVADLGCSPWKYSSPLGNPSIRVWLGVSSSLIAAPAAKSINVAFR
jgi:hypothetical protein